MATVLAAQLAKLSAKSTNQLDLKAQKKAHSKSILFDSKIAASQDFDTIYQICSEGFQELCQIDRRFTKFSTLPFGEHTKSLDRAHMTESENERLGHALNGFLSLVASRLLLKPALKALEWLVRRFRIHEFNTEPLIIAFLPYHSLPLFSKLLSILPEQLPPVFRWLQPYIESAAPPSRRALVNSAIREPTFIVRWSHHVVDACTRGHQYQVLTSYWTTVVSDTIVGQLDKNKAGRREARRQQEEDILHRIIPIINSGLGVPKATDLRIGCYIILAVLASKMDLQQAVLVAAMKAVAKPSGSKVSHAEIACLAVLSQSLDPVLLPDEVLEALVNLSSLEEDLLALSQHHGVGNLCLGLTNGILTSLSDPEKLSRLGLVVKAVDHGLLAGSQLAMATTNILEAADNDVLPMSADTRLRLGHLLERLASTDEAGVVKKAIEDSTVTPRLEAKLQLSLLPVEGQQLLTYDMEMDGVEKASQEETYELLKSKIPTRTAYEVSFLSHTESYVFDGLYRTFVKSLESPENVQDFSNLPVLRKSLASSEPLFLSFFARIWCGPFPSTVRKAALVSMKTFLQENEPSADLQAFLPYILCALGDSSRDVRRATRDLLATWRHVYRNARLDPKDLNIVGQSDLYGDKKHTDGVLWMSSEEVQTVVNDILFDHLEECVLDQHHIARTVSAALIGESGVEAKSPKKSKKDWKPATRAAFLSFIASHILRTPLIAVKTRLLHHIEGVKKAGSSSKSKLLVPLLEEIGSSNELELRERCSKEQLEVSAVCKEIATIVHPSDRDAVKVLQRMISNGDPATPTPLREASMRRLGAIWEAMKLDIQLSSLETLLDLSNSTDELSGDALEVIGDLLLSTEVLKTLIEKLPSLTPELKEGSPTAKRRRTSHGSVDGQSSEATQQSVENALRATTTVLDLVQTSHHAKSSVLVAPLFRVLADMHTIKNKISIDFSYLQYLLLDCLYQCVEVTRKSKESLDTHTIRADLVVDCFRNTTSTQLQQASLLLMSALSGVVPDLLVHSVMPIFTFMGNNILRQADDYSVHVIERTIESVIPPLIESYRKDKRGPLAGVTELLLSFVAAFDHIPIHRRLNLFSALVDRLGVEDYLYALLILLIARQGDYKVSLSFAHELIGKYKSVVQLSTLDKYLEVVMDSLKEKPGPTSNTLLAESKSRQGASAAASALLQLPQQVLKDPRLCSSIRKTLTKDPTEAEKIRSLYAHIVEQALTLSGAAHGNRTLTSSCNSLIDAILSLLTIDESIRSLEHLIEEGDQVVRQQVLQTLDKRINSLKTGDNTARQACIEYLGRLQNIVSSSSDLILRRTALGCIDRIAEKYGKTSLDEMLTVARTVSGEHGLGSSEPTIRLMSIICISTLVEVLGDAIIPFMPQAVPLVLSHSQELIEQPKLDAGLYNAIFSFFGSIFLYVPWLMTGDYLDQFIRLSERSTNKDMESQSDDARSSTIHLMAKQINPLECFSALKRTWDSTISEGPQAVEEHLTVLRVAVDRHAKSVIVKHSQLLAGLFLDIFGLRSQVFERKLDDFDDEDLESLENTAGDILIKVIYKLNDHHFRPIFIKMVEWANDKSSKQVRHSRTHRQTSFYGFLDTFFGTLKSIVTSYASLLVENAVECLSSSSSSDQKSALLWSRVLKTLQAAFEHDQDDFWQLPNRFNSVCEALVSQFENGLTKDVEPTLISCLTSFASAADSPDNLKVLNSGIMKHMRAESANVRLAAVKCEVSITEALGEEWLSLLPEMLPFISEALEDDDEIVELEVRQWVRNIEATLGESLDSMLQ